MDFSKLISSFFNTDSSFNHKCLRTSLVVQRLRLCTPNARGQGSIPGQGTRSHVWQLRVPQLKIPHAAVKIKDPMCLVGQSYLTLCDPMDCSLPGFSVHGGSLGENTGMGCHALLQGNFPSQGSNPGLPNGKPKSTGEGSLSLLQGDLPNPGIKPGSPTL